MEFDQFGPQSDTERDLTVTHREALTLLSALELSPFEDEGLEQKLLDIVYRSGHTLRSRKPRDFTHHRHKQDH